MMSARRVGRRAAATKRQSVQPSVHRGLESIAKGNGPYVSTLLSIDKSATTAEITDALESCMAVNNLSAEMLLARFFDASILSQYSQSVLSKSGKGSAATLASRIVREWAKADFLASSQSAKRKCTEAESNPTNTKRANATAPPSAPHPVSEQDWRSPLFFWKGMLELSTTGTGTSQRPETSALAPDKATGNPEYTVLRYKGSWVAGPAEHGVPHDEHYAADAPQKSFDLVAPLDAGAREGTHGQSDNTGNTPQTMGPITTLLELHAWKGTFTGHYLLDQGDGKGSRKFSDLSHDVAMRAHHGRLYVAACGTTEFGAFVSLGFTPTTSAQAKRTELVLARRYIDDTDPRRDLVKSGAYLTQALDACMVGRFDDVDEHTTKLFWGHNLPWKHGSMKHK